MPVIRISDKTVERAKAIIGKFISKTNIPMKTFEEMSWNERIGMIEDLAEALLEALHGSVWLNVEDIMAFR